LKPYNLKLTHSKEDKMAINYTWDVSTVDTYPTKDSKSDVVYNVHWRLKATDDTNKDSNGNNWTAEVYGSQAVDTSDLSNFKAFADLTASDVQGWVETALGADTVTAKKASLDAQIAKLVTPTSVTKTIG
jgi:hypothetical protein